MQRSLDILAYLIDKYLQGYMQESMFETIDNILEDMSYNEDNLGLYELESLYNALNEIKTFPKCLQKLQSFNVVKQYKKTEEWKHYKKIIDNYMEKNKKRILESSLKSIPLIFI